MAIGPWPRTRRRGGCLLALCAAGRAAPARARVFEGLLPTEPDFALFLGKFCYDFRKPAGTAVGSAKATLLREGPTSPHRGGKLFLMVFDDERQHWRRAQRHWASSSCAEKLDSASFSHELYIQDESEEAHFSLNITEMIRPRFWYFALVGCGLELDSPVRYKLHAINFLLDWQREFSMDHKGLLEMYGVFTGAFFFSTLAAAWATRRRGEEDEPALRDHPYIQLLILSYIASTASCACFLVHYALFSQDGYGVQRLRFLGIVSGIVASSTIFLIAMLASVGWGVTISSLPNRRCFLGGISAVGAIAALCELHSELALDQSTKLYSYQSPAGMLVLILKLFMFCWFAHQVRITYDEELDLSLRAFYKCLGISFSGWALNVPVTVLLAFLIAPYKRYAIVVTVDMGARFLGQALIFRLMCGPMSPINMDNTFVAKDLIGLDSVFDPLADGPGDDL